MERTATHTQRESITYSERDITGNSSQFQYANSHHNKRIVPILSLMVFPAVCIMDWENRNEKSEKKKIQEEGKKGTCLKMWHK